MIVPDQRGYNKSDNPPGADPNRQDTLARDIVGLTDVFCYDKIALAGHDFGGLVSW